MVEHNPGKRGTAAHAAPASKTARRKAAANPGARANPSELDKVLGQFCDARAVIETVCRAMESGDDYPTETSALRTGLSLLNDTYDALDRAINRLALAQVKDSPVEAHF